ncbi:MAG: hypothetical protein V4691_05905, partial [Pseudomonadota bacterium]
DFPNNSATRTITEEELIETLVQKNILPKSKMNYGENGKLDTGEVMLDKNDILRLALYFDVNPEKLKTHSFTNERGKIEYGLSGALFGVYSQKFGDQYTGDSSKLPVVLLAA